MTEILHLTNVKVSADWFLLRTGKKNPLHSCLPAPGVSRQCCLVLDPRLCLAVHTGFSSCVLFSQSPLSLKHQFTQKTSSACVTSTETPSPNKITLQGASVNELGKEGHNLCGQNCPALGHAPWSSCPPTCSDSHRDSSAAMIIHHSLNHND